MTSYLKWSLFLMRIGLGWLMFYAGITKIMAGDWSAAGYLNSATTFSGFYSWLGSPGMVGFVSLLNEWGLTLIGLSLILGIGVRYASILGAALMILYYFPILKFPYPNEHSYIVDEHIIYALAFLVLGASNAGRIYSLEGWFRKK